MKHPEGKRIVSIEPLEDMTFYGEVDPSVHKDCLLGLIEKLAERRDYWKKQNKGVGTAMQLSFTPFTSKNHTPFEYSECLQGMTGRKTLNEAVQLGRDLDVGFRVSSPGETSILSQVITLGDRRMCKIIYDAVKSGEIQYFGGMSCGTDAAAKFEARLKRELGHDFKMYSQAKSYYQVFPWNFIDVGMTPCHRWHRYLLAKEAKNSPFGCLNKCVQCGACQTSQDSLPQVPQKNVTSEFETL